MSLTIFPQRPSRAASDHRRSLTTYTTRIVDPSDPQWRDQPVPNPWLPPEILEDGGWMDERVFIGVERNPAVKGAMASRIAKLLAGGVRLERGEGPGAAELHDVWSEHLAELPMTTLIALAMRGIFRGHEIFEAQGAWVPWSGKRGRPLLFLPVVLRDALTWQFRFTAGRDLIYQPGGLATKGWRMEALPARMKWWTPCYGSLGNPYGEPLHGYYLFRDYVYRKLSDAGFVQIRQAQGFLKVVHDFASPGSDLSAEGEVLSAAAVAKIRSIIDDLQATGVLWQPAGWDVGWEALSGAVDGWIRVFNYFDDDARSFYSGSNLATQARGTATGRAGGEVQERSVMDLAKVDAEMFGEQFRGFMRAWSAFNASRISRDFQPSAATARLDDVPMRAVPRVNFRGLSKVRTEDLKALEIVLKTGVVPAEDGTATRVDVNELLDQIRVPLLDEDQDGPTLDLSRQVPAPSPFGPQDLPLGDRRGEDETPESEDDADDDE